jgi:hypothetical protein
MLISDEYLRVVFGADRFEPFRARIGITRVSLVDRPWPRQSMIYDGDLIMQNVPIGFVQIDAFLEYRLIVFVQRQAGSVEFPGALEPPGFNLQDVVAAFAALIYPSADRVARIGRLGLCGPIPPTSV